MPANTKYDWFPLHQPELTSYQRTFHAFHHALQNVASVGRSYIDPSSENDENAVLSWVPGLWRLVGKWVHGSTPFRSSLGFKDFSIHLVDQKINPLGHFEMSGHSYNDAMIWLEEQIITQNLSSKALTTKLPYDLPAYASDNKSKFPPEDELIGESLGGFFHDAFILQSMMKEQSENSTDIVVYPRRFDMETKIILKETDEMATNTFVRLGFCPGDGQIKEPYLYINSWPYVNIEETGSLPVDCFWENERIVGMILTLANAYQENDQLEYLLNFYQEGFEAFKTRLLD
jgi:hypothetical protein